MRLAVIGTGLYDPAAMARQGFEYHSIGRPSVGAAGTAGLERRTGGERRARVGAI